MRITVDEMRSAFYTKTNGNHLCSTGSV